MTPAIGAARLDAVSAAVLAALAVVVQLVGGGKPWLDLPVTATFARGPVGPERSSAAFTLGEASVAVATVHLASAVAVLLLFVAVVRALSLVPAVRARRQAATDADRHRSRWLEFSQVAGVTAFLVAQLNGVSEVTSLVPIYALSAGSVLLLVLHDRRREAGRAGLWAFSFGTAIGIVPWGVIAFAQLGGTVAGVGPGPLVSVTTIAALIAVAAVWVVAWAFGRGPRTAPVGERTDRALALTVPLAPVALAAAALIG